VKVVKAVKISFGIPEEFRSKTLHVLHELHG
jgi:hypothetical protein